MKVKAGLVLGIIFSLIFISTGFVFSQEQEPSQAPAQETAPQPEAAQPDIQWVWGEVVSLDLNAKQLVVKYLDYETDSEKEVNIVIDEATTYENAQSIGEIKPQDTVSIDYVIDLKGNNVAKNISVEKPESQEALPEDNLGAEVKPAP